MEKSLNMKEKNVLQSVKVKFIQCLTMIGEEETEIDTERISDKGLNNADDRNNTVILVDFKAFAFSKRRNYWRFKITTHSGLNI